MSRFKRDLSQVDLCSYKYDELLNPGYLDMLLHDYDNKLRDFLDRHAPLKRKTVKVRTMVPWYNSDILEAKRQRRKVERT